MKKVICAACGLVNLEKFVSFPHCAACGARLSDVKPARIGWWKRPVSAPLWASILGCCCAAIGVAGILTARETRRPEIRRLIVYVQPPRGLRVGNVDELELGIDSISSRAYVEENFQDLELRLPPSFNRNFVLVSIFPLPQTQTRRGDGSYFGFARFKREQRLIIALRPRRVGSHRVAFSLRAAEFLPYEWLGTLRVGPQRVKGARGASN